MFQDSVDITNILSVCFLFASAGLECVGCSFDFLKVGSVDIYYLANLFPIFDKVMTQRSLRPSAPPLLSPSSPACFRWMHQTSNTQKSQRGKPVFRIALSARVTRSERTVTLSQHFPGPSYSMLPLCLCSFLTVSILLPHPRKEQ